jgi:hypothetical protein
MLRDGAIIFGDLIGKVDTLQLNVRSANASSGHRAVGFGNRAQVNQGGSIP